MKAHIPAKKALSAPTKKAVRKYVEEYERDCMRRFFSWRARRFMKNLASAKIGLRGLSLLRRETPRERMRFFGGTRTNF